MDKKFKVALLGTRGVPSNYSGFETCVEQLGQRLVKRGYDVTVYCRAQHIQYPKDKYLGMKLVKLPTIPNKYLDTFFHTLICSIHTLFMKYDVCLYFIAGNSPMTWLPRLVGTKTILNVDRLDWKRKKWPVLAKKYIQLAEYLATKLPNYFITDSRVVQKYYQEKFGVTPSYIPYGSEINLISQGITLDKYDLEKDKYILFVGRLVPENHVEHLILAFRKHATKLKLVIVGDATYAGEYIRSLHKMAEGDERIIFTGYIFGDGYAELGTNAYIFVETSGVGGTHPAIIEAMAFGSCIVVHNTPENLETVADTALAYDGKKGEQSLYKVLNELLSNKDLVRMMRKKSFARAKQVYQWEKVTDMYESLFKGEI